MSTEALSSSVASGLLSEVRVHHPEAAYSLARLLDALQSELAQKDATIKALSEALQRINDLAEDIEEGPIGTIQAECDAALRLAGVLK